MKVNPPITHIQQITRYDCWHASLMMILNWKRDKPKKPGGALTTWLYNMCRAGENGYRHTLATQLSNIKNPSNIDKYHASRYAKSRVSEWANTRVLVSNKNTYTPFSDKPGLTKPLLPTILAENNLRAVRGGIIDEMGIDAKSVEKTLRKYGPLYCLVNWGHVVVISGVKSNETLYVNDPLNDGQTETSINIVKMSPGIARLTGHCLAQSEGKSVI